MFADRTKIEELIRTSLYDTDGESVEGAFVDRWESYAGRANEALAEIYQEQGFTEADAVLIREAIRQPEAPLEAVASLSIELAHWIQPILPAMRNSPSPRERAVAVRILGDTSFLWRIRQDLDLDVLLQGLVDPEVAVRETTVRMLSLLPRRKEALQAETALALALEDEAPCVRMAAGSALTFLNRPEGAAALLRCLEHETDKSVRRTLLLAIADQIRKEGVHTGYAGRLPMRQQVGEPLVALLLRTLSDAEVPVRVGIVKALHEVGGTDVALALLERLRKEAHPDVRYVLLRYPDRQYSQIIGQALPVFTELLESDPSAQVRSQAVWVLKGCGLHARPLLRAALENPMPEVRAAATRVLEMLGE